MPAATGGEFLWSARVFQDELGEVILIDTLVQRYKLREGRVQTGCRASPVFTVCLRA